MAVALLVFAGGQLALCGARRLARTKAYKRSLHRVRAMRSVSLRRRGPNGADGSTSDKDGAAAAGGNGQLADGCVGLGLDREADEERAAAAGAGAAAADPEEALSAVVADMAARMQLRS